MTQDISLLLVDDEAAFVATMEKRLARRGFTIKTALSGTEALEMIDAHGDIEVVILDVRMQDLDGISTLAEIKLRRPLVEVIMLTGHATVESAVEGMRLGAFDYLLKPCEMETLMAKVQDACAQKRHREEKIVAARLRDIASRCA